MGATQSGSGGASGADENTFVPQTIILRFGSVRQRTDDREAYAQGRLIKDGMGGSMAWYFHQPSNPREQDGGNSQ